MNQASIKEYYINLQKLYTNAVNLLNGINKSLTSNISDISVSLINNDNTESVVNIPSFLYLESRIEELTNNFDSLVNLPKDGDAWISTTGNQHKITVAKTNSAPPAPSLNTNYAITGAFEKNKYLSNLLSPYTTLRLNLNNVPENVCNFVVKKLIIKSADIYEKLNLNNIYRTYSEIKSVLYNISSDINVNTSAIYEEADIEIKAPHNKDKYNSAFSLVELVTRDNNKPNPYYLSSDDKKLVYDIILDTIEYYDNDKSYVTYNLEVGDYITLINDYAVYEVISISNETMSDGSVTHKVSIKETIGHILLQPISINNNMQFKIYGKNNKNNYIDIPLDSNQYVILFIASSYNNYISNYSNAIFIDLSAIKMVNFESRTPYLINESEITYLDFFNRYCKNYGELITKLGGLLSPSPELYSNTQLQELQESEALTSVIDNTFNAGILKVICINEHILSIINSTDLKNNIDKKNSLLKEIDSYNNQIEKAEEDLKGASQSTYSTYSTNLSKLKETRAACYKELYNITSSINEAYSLAKNSLNKDKFRIRGVINNISEFETYIHNMYGTNIYVSKIDVEYKYVSVNDDNDKITNISGSTFSNWNKMTTIERDRTINLLNDNKMYISYVDNSNIENIIKWNQIDIPITYNENVIIRLRYKYNIGNPFIELYSPWSSEITMTLPDEYSSQINLSNSIEQNQTDNIISSVFNQLNEEGYTAHNDDSYIYNGKKYFHTADSILVQYSPISTDASQKISTLNSVIDNLYDYINDLEDEIKQIKETPLETTNNTYYQTPGGSDDPDINELATAILEIQTSLGSIDSVEGSINELDTRVEETENTNIEQSERLDNIEASLGSIESVEESISTLENRMSSVEESITNQQDDIDNIKSSIGDINVEASISDISNRLDTAEGTIQTLNNKVATIETSLGSIESVETSITGLQSNVEIINDHLTTLDNSKENIVGIVNGEIENNSISPQIGAYTIINNNPVTQLNISLPSITETPTTHLLSLSLQFETGESENDIDDAFVFTANDNVPILYYKNFFIEPAMHYEINAIFEGTHWVVSYGILSTTRNDSINE